MAEIALGTERIEKRFKELKKAGRAGLITFITAGDPNIKISAQILQKLPSSGADIIELGMPFSDPMADGAAIQASSLRSLRNGGSIHTTIEMVRHFRELPVCRMLGGHFLVETIRCNGCSCSRNDGWWRCRNANGYCQSNIFTLLVDNTYPKFFPLVTSHLSWGPWLPLY